MVKKADFFLLFYEALNFATNFKGNYTFVISLYSTTTSVLPREIYEFMNKLNINISDINYNMVYVVSNGKIVYSNDYQFYIRKTTSF